jgi:hypothetical protein
MPATITLTDMKQIINKNPDTAQNSFEANLTKKYKNGVISIEEYKEGIKRLDFIFDVLSVRKQIFGDEKTPDGRFKYQGAFGSIPNVPEKKEKSLWDKTTDIFGNLID